MIIELMGQPASGKTELIKTLNNTNGYVPLDYLYNKKTRFGKFLYFFRHFYYFSSENFKICKKIIRKALCDRNHKMQKFFLRQFRVDYCLMTDALKLSKNGYTCLFSENFYNLFSYIFFYNESEQKKWLFQELMKDFPEVFLRRKAIIVVNVDVEKNLEYKSSRAGIEKEKFVLETDFYNDFSKVADAQHKAIELLKAFSDKVLFFNNSYSSKSIKSFVELVDLV